MYLISFLKGHAVCRSAAMKKLGFEFWKRVVMIRFELDLFMKKSIFVLLLSVLFVSHASAQFTRKPSPSREPEGVMDKTPDSNKRSLSAINSRADFDLMARIYHSGTPYALPHVMFAIDRRNKGKVYFINSQKYRFHKDFLIANYLVIKGSDFFTDTYVREDRRFIVGTIAWQSPVSRFTFEFWDGDLIPQKLIQEAHDAINKSFYEKVAFKPNSTRHEEYSKNLGIEVISSDEISKNQEYLALNTGRAVGRIHVIDKLDDTVEIGYNEILVLNEVPINLPPVAGIIVSKPSTPLSHVNLLAKGWGIPNAYIKDADKLFKEYDTWFVEFETTMTNYTIKKADSAALDAEQKRRESLGQVFRDAPSNLATTKIETLKLLKKTRSVEYGAKAANLGHIAGARIKGIVVADGFAIPFKYYDDFMKENGFYDRFLDLSIDNDFVHNPKVRRAKLEEFRTAIKAGKFDQKLRDDIIAKWKTVTGGKGVFVRSSSNVEDLPNFSGAGLYETVPNVVSEDALIEAVKTVWASIWNFDAYEARERNFVFHDSARMAVLVQVGVDVDNSGVMVTKDPFDPENKGAVYISAKRGVGIKVVDGKKVAEQILFSPKSNAVQVLTRSQEDTLLRFDDQGGVIEVPIEGARDVLNDKKARELVAAAKAIKQLFGNKKEQDIEWGTKGGTVFIFQSRPFIDYTQLK
ncbi:MAG: PEP/pyruvate-binding domain-containing protein [Pyrinomonadaceae bacterium]